MPPDQAVHAAVSQSGTLPGHHVEVSPLQLKGTLDVRILWYMRASANACPHADKTSSTPCSQSIALTAEDKTQGCHENGQHKVL